MTQYNCLQDTWRGFSAPQQCAIITEQHEESPLQRGSMWQPEQLHNCAKKRKLRSLVTFHHSGLVKGNPSDVWESAAS